MAAFTCLSTASPPARPLVSLSKAHSMKQARTNYTATSCNSNSGRRSSSMHPMAMASSRSSGKASKVGRTITPLASELWGSRGMELCTWKNSDPSAGQRQPVIRAAVVVSKRVISLVVAVGLPVLLASANTIVNNPNTSFYKDLKKPSFNPPNWLFGLIWGVLYPVMGLASWLVWSEGGFEQQAIPLTSYVVQLVLNLLWPPIFFTAHKLQGALVDLAALVVAVAITAFLFKPVNPLAFYLFLPYLAWVSFATFLNYKYVTLNTSSAGDQPQPA